MIFIKTGIQFAYYTHKQGKKNQKCAIKKEKNIHSIVLVQTESTNNQSYTVSFNYDILQQWNTCSFTIGKNLTKYCTHLLINLKSNKVCVHVRFWYKFFIQPFKTSIQPFKISEGKCRKKFFRKGRKKENKNSERLKNGDAIAE